MKAIRKLWGVATRPHNHRYAGHCNICRRRTIFVADEPAEPLIRRCVWCRGTPKYRAIVEVLQQRLGQPIGAALDAGRRIYELSTTSPIHRSFRSHPSYTASAFLADQPFGREIRPRVWNQDVQRLSFPDGSFDIVISSETMEHVRHPWAGFREIARVLKPGGLHCFTIPYRPDRLTTARVDTSGPEDRHILPPAYHLDPYCARGALVYTDYGRDLPELLQGCGFRTEEYELFQHREDIRDDQRPMRVFLSTRL